MTTTIFNMTKDVAGYNGFGLIPSTVKKGVALAQNVAQSFVVPSDSSTYLVIFVYTPGSNVFVNFTTTAAAFPGAIANVTSELSPIARQVAAGTTISLLTPDAAGAYVNALIYIVSPYTNG